ncbi:hypothetical protein IFM89_005966 [Coptis chinensis]|uniref:Virilizer N-terminal domain-containing protein n=1 Tax=Coptis chinensis TaxID=261450 RepID=A0A835LHM4_9MAGN|nr:hypothetical protein IFM89_005966 [Coptis chinensis]
MGRPDPCVLFSQTFLHPQLDEFVDEVIFAEPIVITACEFLEQNIPSSSSLVKLVGATSPSSFALEVFVQCEGETRFRRLCQPFLYSPSSSNMLEVEAVVTNHLVVRGSYRSLTLVVYGNTAEDLGQFNIEFDLDSSLANLVRSPTEGKLEDLPPALRSTKLTLEESICRPKFLSLPVAESEFSFEVEQFLQLLVKIFDASNSVDTTQRVLSTVIAAVSSYVTSDLGCTAITRNQCKQTDMLPCGKELETIRTEAKHELQELYKILQNEASSLSDDLLGEGVAIKSELELDIAPIDNLPDVFSWYDLFNRIFSSNGKSIPQTKSMILGLSMVYLLCSCKEHCFHFFNGGGMEQLVRVFHHETQKSTAVRLLLLGIIEQATRYAIGCEGFLGWWPRDDEIVPVGSSEGYSQILKLLLRKQRHDVASLAAYLLHRLRSYEVAARYESAVLSLLAGLSDVSKVSKVTLDMLDSTRLQLKKLMKMLNFRGPIEDPSPVANARRSLILDQTEGLLSYRATINLIALSNCGFSNVIIDPHLLSLLKERGFFPLSAALLSSSVLRSQKGHTLDMFLDIASLVETILLSLLSCRSGLLFLLLQPEVAAALVHSLKGVEDNNKGECLPLRYASVLIKKGFFCLPQDVGMITELHLRVVNAIDLLLASTPQSDDLLWILWELCGLSRSDSGRQALLALGHFPEAILILMESLRSAKEVEPVSSNSGGMFTSGFFSLHALFVLARVMVIQLRSGNAGSSPLNLAIFHSAAEIFEVIVTDSTASSLSSWIEHSVELHKVLHSSSPGSNRKDAPTRLLEWIDAGVVYQRNGAIGLLRYAAVLASGGDAHLTSTSILVSDSMDVENVVGDPAGGSDIQFIDTLLGKLVSDKSFEGITLRDSSIAQLTTTFRILSFISENSSVAAALYEEGAVTLIYVVLINCKCMLERSSSTYDYLVDEGAECNSTSDMLLERGREQSLVDLMIPSIVLLITLLHKLQEAKEQHRNTKLLNALLRLHREVSPKLAACAADLSSPYPGSALGLAAVCRLLVSALACWPVFGWTPGLFHCLLDSVQVTSSLALGPKEACSVLCLLGDLFPEEGIWLWKTGMPSLSALKSLAIATVLGPLKERHVDWYLQPGHVATLLSRLMPLLEKFAQIVLHFAFSALVVIQDMLRVLIVRIASQKPDSAIILLRPIISWIHDHVSEAHFLSDTDVFKVYRLLDFLASLLEHPCAKVYINTLLLRGGVVGILIKALDKCSSSYGPEGKLITESRSYNCGFTLRNWCFPVFKSIALICGSQTSLQHSGVYDNSGKMSVKDCSSILHHLLKLCQVLPVGKELLASLIAFKELASCSEGRSAFASISTHFQSFSLDEVELESRHEQDGHDGVIDNSDGRMSPPLLYFWRNISKSVGGRECLSTHAIESVGALSLGALCLCVEGKRSQLLTSNSYPTPNGRPRQVELEVNETTEYPRNEGKVLLYLFQLELYCLMVADVKEMAKLLLLLLEKPVGSIKVDEIICTGGFCLLSSDIVDHFTFTSITMMNIINEDPRLLNLRIRKSDDILEKTEDLFSFSGLADKFLWDCPDSLRDRLSTPTLPAKRKMPPMELPNRRSRGENSGTETTGTNAFVRGLGPPNTSLGPTRNTFRHRKPNTSRPPSMHVDDYVARERNIDGASTGSNVVSSIQRGVTGGRPPSIHVDEFMARQRERQVPLALAGGEVAAQTRNVLPPENDIDPEKVDRSRKLKADLDDDLHGINIVFDDEESESDDKLPFPQQDDNLQPAPVVAEGSPPRSIVEETESETNDNTHGPNMGTPSTSNADEYTQSEFSSKRSVSRPLSREASVSSERKFVNANIDKSYSRAKPDDAKHSAQTMASNGFDSATKRFSGFPPPFYKGSPSGQLGGDSRMPPSNFYQRNIPQHAPNVPLVSGSQGLYNQKFVPNQPPLPLTPPPATVSCAVSQSPESVLSHSSPYGHNIRDGPPPLPPGFPSQAYEVGGSITAPAYNMSEDRSAIHNYAVGLNLPTSSSSFVDSRNDPSQMQPILNSSMTVLAAAHTMFDSKYSWASVPSASSAPPLPLTPPPYSASSITQSSVKSSTSQSTGYNQTNVGTIQLPLKSNSPSSDAQLANLSTSGGNLTSYSPPQLVALNGRPASIPVTLFSSSTIYQGPNLPGLSHSISATQSSVLSVQPRQQLQPLQPPQPPHPHPQHFRPPIQVSQQQSEVSLLQSPIQVQTHPFQIHQQPHISPIQVYYPPQQHENLQHTLLQQQVGLSQPQVVQKQGDNVSQLQVSEMSVQQYSPEEIQSLISDREKLCQLLEQNPKLMQMLQWGKVSC